MSSPQYPICFLRDSSCYWRLGEEGVRVEGREGEEGVVEFAFFVDDTVHVI